MISRIGETKTDQKAKYVGVVVHADGQARVVAVGRWVRFL